MKVEVYWNIRRHVFSVRALDGDYRGRVIGHATKVILEGVTYTVQDAGRLKVIETGHKNVHAFIRGNLAAVKWDRTVFDLDDDWNSDDDDYADGLYGHTGVPVRYNPRECLTFVDVSLRTGKADDVREESPSAYLEAFGSKPAIWAEDYRKRSSYL